MWFDIFRFFTEQDDPFTWHAECLLKKKNNLLTYTGLHISVTFATFYWNSQAWKKIKKTKLFASCIEKGSFLLIKEKKSGSPWGCPQQLIRDLKQRWLRQQWKRHQKNEFAFFQT